MQRFTIAMAALAIMARATAACAGNTAEQTIRFVVRGVSQISVSGSPAPMILETPASGSGIRWVSDSSTRHAVTTNESVKITGRLDGEMPEGVQLSVTLGAPSGAQARTDVPLTSGDRELITGIFKQCVAGQSITYRLSAKPVGPRVISGVKTVIFTVSE
ncbi:MAG: hypothetical protein HY815_03975 [Candidatus Riflebacteria bacterium]|nr:hypothetical protein [Candidatus Riflebacteria bacterium]